MTLLCSQNVKRNFYIQSGTLATGGDAYITIPGAYVGIYGGGTLSDDVGPTAETTSGTIQAYGQPLQIRVNTYGVDNSATLGFDLIYNQLPCGTNNIANGYNRNLG